MGWFKTFMWTVGVLVISIVLIFPQLEKALDMMSEALQKGTTIQISNSTQKSTQKSIVQAMKEEKEWLTKGLKEAADVLKGATAKDKSNKKDIFTWFEDALKSYNNFEGAYNRMNGQHKLWAGKIFNPDEVFKRWPGILLNGDTPENKMLYLTDQEGKPIEDIAKMPNKEAEDRFHKLIRDVHIHCLNRRRMGNMHDGGWDICTSGPFMPKKNDCLVYSFGINNDYSFDDAMAKNYGCHVYSFDPSMGVATHNHSKHVHFFSLGISDKDEYNAKKKWTLKSLDTIFKQNGHSNKIITILKMDIEGMEPNILRKVVKTDILKNVMQFYFEIHLFHYTKAQLYDLHTLLNALEKLGFRRFYYHRNRHCGRVSGITGMQRSMCHELYYINTNFLS